MKVEDIIRKKRTIRLFLDKKIPFEILERCVDAARLSSSARNAQPLEYIIVDDTDVLEKIMPLINFGGFISEDKKAKKGNEPKALIIIIAKKGSGDYYRYDVGIAAQNISLVAFENGLGCCMMGAVDKKKIEKVLGVSEDYFVDLVIAMGYPAEEPIAKDSEDIEYYRKEGILYIPKRRLKKVMHRNKF